MLDAGQFNKGANMKLRKLLIVPLLVVLMPLMAACPAGQQGGGVGSNDGRPGFEDPAPGVKRPNCPDIEFRADDERCFVIQTFVESRLGPYDVYIEIRGGEGVYPPHVPVASGGWKHAVVYRTGAEISIKVTLRYEGAESKDGFCSITDANELYKKPLKSIRAEGGSPYEAVCALTTSQ